MSDIATDTRAIANGMAPWRAPKVYLTKDVPDWEYLRVHALRLADAFEEVREERNAANRRNKIMLDAVAPLQNALEHIDQADYPESVDVDYVILNVKEALDKVKGTKEQ